MAHTRTVMFVFQVIVSSFVSAAGTPTFGGVVGCTADEDCFSGTNWRCIDGQSVGSPCTLDRGYNTTSKCICGVQDCVPLPVTKPTAGFRQYLVIGDSVSMGYFHSLAANLTANGGKWDVIHAPGNNDNTNWGQRCLRGWLGTDPHRWDIVTMNWGLHDLAFPDNEHLSVDTYSMFLRKITEQLHEMLRPDARVVWVSTTPVPTNPPPDPTTNKSCVLIPGRIEADVLRYNAAAEAVVKSAPQHISTCDLHQVIIDHCGIGYRTCDIAQCAGPHFVGNGFELLGTSLAAFVSALFS